MPTEHSTLQQPDRPLADQLLEMAPYAAHTPETEALFHNALAEAIRQHRNGNQLYAEFLARNNFSPDGSFALEDIPFLPVQVFKALGSSLTTVPQEDIRLSLSSSATSGIPSTVPIDSITARRQAKCMSRTIADVIGKTRRPFLVLDAAPGKAGTAYGARGAALRGYMTFASRAAFFMEERPDGLHFLSEDFARTVQDLDPAVPVVLFGFTYVLYGAAVRPSLIKGERFPLPKGSHVLHIGGWKKLESEKVSRERFAEDIRTVFDVDADHLVDVYGFTEQMGLNYPDCPCGCKHVPHMSRILVRDPVTHALRPEGQAGVLEFISPLPHSYPGVAVLTDDVGEIVPGPCPLGRHGTRFRILGRLKKAEPRGCGDIMGEKLRTRMPSKEIANDEKHSPLRLRAWGDTPQDMEALIAHAQNARIWLQQQPVEGIIGLIDSVASTWEDNPELAGWKYQGLSFLSRWCSAANLRALARQALRGLDNALDAFTPEAARKTHFLRAKPAGLVVHWLSGNVPLLAMLVLVQSLLAKNGNILKTASNNLEALEKLLSTFEGKSYTTAAGHVVTGDELLRTISLVHYPHHAQELAQQLSTAADVRIAWGGRAAVDAICALPARAEATDIVFGPKTSFMVIAREALQDEAGVRKLLRRAATDVSSFDQAACSSPHTIFVETGGIISPVAFAQRLGEALERALTLIPKTPEDEATSAAVQTARAVGGFLGRCWHSDGPGWTVLYDERLELAAPVYARTITVRPVQDIMTTVPLVHEGIQTIGLAAEGERRFRFAEEACARGALRFPEIGAMTGFDAPWDGFFVLDRLVRWVTLGGAASAVATPQSRER